MDKYAAERALMLGMPLGTAMARMRKALMFNMASKLDMLNCFQCGKPIENIDEFSIEHKEPWQASTDPATAFFAIENLAFSHHKCNIGAARHPNKRHATEADRKREQYARYYGRAKDQVLLRKRERWAKKRNYAEQPQEPSSP